MPPQPSPFELFCVYYLGLTPEGEYRFVNGNQVAQRYNWTVDDLLRQLKKHSLDPDTVLNTDFPMAKYQIDIQLASDAEVGSQLLSRAKEIFEEFKSRLGHARDWLKEIEGEKEADRQKGRQ